jgi:hypothetical protein
MPKSEVPHLPLSTKLPEVFAQIEKYLEAGFRTVEKEAAHALKPGGSLADTGSNSNARSRPNCESLRAVEVISALTPAPARRPISGSPNRIATHSVSRSVDVFVGAASTPETIDAAHRLRDHHTRPHAGWCKAISVNTCAFNYLRNLVYSR